MTRGPTLPPAWLLGSLLALQLATFMQGPLASAIAGPPERREAALALTLAWGGCHAAGAAVAMGCLWLLAAPGLRSWLMFYVVLAAAALTGGAARVALCQMAFPSLLAGKSVVQQVLHTGLVFLVLMLLAEVFAAMRARRARSLAERRTLAASLARSRAEMVGTDDAQRRELAELLHGKLQTYLVVAGANVAAAGGPGGDEALAEAEQAMVLLRDEALGRFRARLGDGGDLAAELAEVVGRFREVRAVGFEADAPALAAARALPPRQARMAALLVTEALLNAHRHTAPATRLEVALRGLADGGVEAIVRDDGGGFRPGEGAGDTGGGLGLGGLAEGLAELGAAWTVDNQPGRGVTVALRLPGARP